MPAKIIKDVTPEQKSYARFGVEDYLRLTEEYLKGMKLISQ